MTAVTNLLPTIAPKSDQLNADDLIGRNITIRITKVSILGEPDQPVALNYEGDAGKPYKPCKSMRRVLVNVWGGDGNAYVGRSLTLYRDDRVQFGGEAVGGIRISHMSDIDRDVTMALTTTRAKRKPYTVKPLAVTQGGSATGVDLAPILAAGREAAKRGSAALTAWWSELSKAEKAAAKPTLDAELKAAATQADQASFDDDGDADTNSAARDAPEDGATQNSGANGAATKPMSLADRIAAFKKRVTEAPSLEKMTAHWTASAALRNDIDQADADEVGTTAELEMWFNQAYAERAGG